VKVLEIILYPDLSKCQDLRGLLTNDKDCCIILYEEKKLEGHWTCITRLFDLFEFFDSYGIRFDSELKWLSWKTRLQLNEAIPYLSNLLKGEKYEYKKVKYQDDNPNVETCGAHVCHFLHCFLHLDMDLDKYKRIYGHNEKKEMNQPYDYIVASYVEHTLSLDVK